MISFFGYSYERKSTLFWVWTFLLIHLTFSSAYYSINGTFYQRKVQVFELKSSFDFLGTVTKEKSLCFKIWLFFLFIKLFLSSKNYLMPETLCERKFKVFELKWSFYFLGILTREKPLCFEIWLFFLIHLTLSLK